MNFFEQGRNWYQVVNQVKIKLKLTGNQIPFRGTRLGFIQVSNMHGRVASFYTYIKTSLVPRVHFQKYWLLRYALLSLFSYRHIENEGEKKLMKITFDNIGKALERPLANQITLQDINFHKSSFSSNMTSNLQGSQVC